MPLILNENRGKATTILTIKLEGKGERGQPSGTPRLVTHTDEWARTQLRLFEYRDWKTEMDFPGTCASEDNTRKNCTINWAEQRTETTSIVTHTSILRALDNRWRIMPREKFRCNAQQTNSSMSFIQFCVNTATDTEKLTWFPNQPHRSFPKRSKQHSWFGRSLVAWRCHKDPNRLEKTRNLPRRYVSD